MSVINWTKFTNISFFKHTRCIVSPSGLFIIRSGATNLSNTVLQRCITAYVLAEGGKLAKNVRLTWKHSRNAGNLVQCDILSSAHLKQLFFLSFTHSWTLLYFKAIRPCILYTDVLVDRGVVITVICESSEISCVHRAKTFTQNENPDIIYVLIQTRMTFFIWLNTKYDVLKNVHAALIHTTIPYNDHGLPRSKNHHKSTKKYHLYYSYSLLKSYNNSVWQTDWNPRHIFMHKLMQNLMWELMSLTVNH